MPRIARPPARAACVAASGVLVVGTGVLAFRSGFEDVRAFGGVVAWGLAAVLALVLPRERLIPSRAGAVALAGLALLTVWTAIAESWAPLPDLAGDDLERLLLYLGAFIAGLLAFSEVAARRLLEPGLVLLGVTIIGYGLTERFFPDELDFSAIQSAAGRLAQPLTYWNAMGAVAAVALVLAVGIASDPTRGRLRIPAGGVTPILGLGLYLSLSRGAMLAAVLGLASFVCLLPRRPQFVAAGIGAAAVVAAILATGVDPEREGVGLMAVTLLLCALAGAATWGLLVRAGPGATTNSAPRTGRRVVAAIAVLVLLIPVIGAPLDFRAGDAPDTADAGRFRSVGSARYAYWRVAIEAVPDDPLKGVGPSGYRVLWTRDRPIDEVVGEAHSLQLETAAELGLPGLGFLFLFIGGTFASAANALRRDGAAAGIAAALLTWMVSASVDWMWELPAVALIGLVLSAALVAEARASRASETGG